MVEDLTDFCCGEWMVEDGDKCRGEELASDRLLLRPMPCARCVAAVALCREMWADCGRSLRCSSDTQSNENTDSVECDRLTRIGGAPFLDFPDPVVLGGEMVGESAYSEVVVMGDMICWRQCAVSGLTKVTGCTAVFGVSTEKT